VIVVVQNGLPATSSESLKETVPVCGVALPGKFAPVLVGANDAERLTLWFTAEGLTGDETVVVVGATSTVCATVGALPARKFESPL